MQTGSVGVKDIPLFKSFHSDSKDGLFQQPINVHQVEPTGPDLLSVFEKADTWICCQVWIPLLKCADTT